MKMLTSSRMDTPMPSFKAAAKAFFNKDAVIKAVNAAERKTLSYAGGYVRKVAQASILPARNKGQKTKRNSKPGEAPRDQTGRLKRFINYSYDAGASSVVVGPSVLGGKGRIPKVLEHGGMSRISLKRPKLGQGHKATGAKRRFRWERTGEFKNVIIAKRPFMAPALVKSESKLAAIWRGAVK